MSSTWHIQKSGTSFILRKDDKTVGTIQTIAASKTVGSVNIKLIGDDELVTSSLTTYRSEKNNPFITCLSSRTRFVEKWNEISKDSIPEVQNEGSSITAEKVEHAEIHLEDKLAYSYVLVHIMNMKEPAEERKFRDVDQKHVNELKAKIIQNPDLKCRIMLGNTTENKQCITEDLLKTPGKVDVEVIGGNHTRTAIMKILNDPLYKYDTRYHVWPMKVYCQLDRIQAQKLGFDHNIENDSVRPTTAFEILQFARKELLTLTDELHVYTAPQIKQWKSNIMHVLNLTKDDLHNKYKTLVSLAKCPSCVWEKLLQFEELWRKQLIKGQAPGDIKTAHLKCISLLPEKDQVELLNDLIQRNLTWKDFKKCCSKKQKDQQKTKDVEVSDDQIDVEHNQSAEEHDQIAVEQPAISGQPERRLHIDDTEREQCKDFKRKLEIALATIRLLTEESDNLKSQLAHAENKNKTTEEHLARIQSEKSELLHGVELLKSQKRELEDDIAYYLHKDKQDHDLSSPSSKRKGTDTEIDQLTVQHANKKVRKQAEEFPEFGGSETDESEPQEKIVFVEYTRRRGFLAVQNTSKKSVRYCKSAICQSVRCASLKFHSNSLALEEKAYCLDKQYIITEVPNSIIYVGENELVILKDEDVLRNFLMESISTYLDAQT